MGRGDLRDVRELSTVVAYSLGVSDKYLSQGVRKNQIYTFDSLCKDIELTELRDTCIARNILMKKVSSFTPEDIGVNPVLSTTKFPFGSYLRITKLLGEATDCTFDSLFELLNEAIDERVNTLRRFLVDEEHWSWVLELFKWTAGNSIKDLWSVSIEYTRNIFNYPYRVWVNMTNPCRELVHNDYFMMFFIYKEHGAVLGNIAQYKDSINNRLLVDYSNMQNANDSLEFVKGMLDSGESLVLVDTQNTPPVYAFEFLSWISQEYPLAISQVVLFVDGSESSKWCQAEFLIPFQVKRIDVERIRRDKSAVDPELLGYAIKQYYENSCSSFFIFSSDCDFFSLSKILSSAYICYCGTSHRTGNSSLDYLNRFQNSKFIVIDDFMRMAKVADSLPKQTFLPTIVDKVNLMQVSAENLIHSVALACGGGNREVIDTTAISVLNDIFSQYTVNVTSDGCLQFLAIRNDTRR